MKANGRRLSREAARSECAGPCIAPQLSMHIASAAQARIISNKLGSGRKERTPVVKVEDIRYQAP